MNNQSEEQNQPQNNPSTPKPIIVSRQNLRQVPLSLQVLEPYQGKEQIHGHTLKHQKKQTVSNSVNNFIQKTYNILQQKRYESIVSWSDSEGRPISSKLITTGDEARGSGFRKTQTRCGSFKIHNIKAFQEIVLPIYFKHSNLSYFVRQLNMYNFHKVRGERTQFEFQHEKFIKNRPDLLSQIKRKPIQSSYHIPSITLLPMPDHSSLAPQHQGFKSTSQNFLNISDKKKPFSQFQLPYSYNQLEQPQVPLKLQQANNPQNMQILAQLQEINRNLKKIKQQKLAVLKQFSSGSNSNSAHKFNKSIMALISHKLTSNLQQKQLNIRADSNGIQQLIDHILDQSSPRTLKDYYYLIKEGGLARGAS